jgi:DNA-binding phage protein
MKSFHEFLQQILSEENYPSLDDLSSDEYKGMKDRNQIKYYINQAEKNKDGEALLHLKKVANKAGHLDLSNMADSAYKKIRG